MASQDEVQRQLAELSARVDALAAAVEALQGTHAGSQTAANAASAPHSPPSAVHGVSPAGSVPRQSNPVIMSKVDLVTSTPAAGGKGTLEDRIGSQLLNRIGIFAVLIAVAWFLKLAFDRNWIGPDVRIVLGIVIAAGMMAWSERFRARGFCAFSYTLKALGTGIAYLSLWAAWSLYHLLPAGIVFAVMLVITLANAFLAWNQDSELLAIYALAGGLATPALLSVGGGHEFFLFSYLLMLNAGALLLFGLRPWKRLVTAAFLGTVTYCAAWDLRSYDPSAFSITLIFVALFFLVFAGVSFLYQRKAALPRSRSLFLIVFPIANGVVAFAALMSLFGDSSHHPPIDITRDPKWKIVGQVLWWVIRDQEA